MKSARSSNHPAAALETLRQLRVLAVEPTLVRVGHARAELEISVLAPDLFRLRAAPPGTRPPPSWAVLPQSAAPVPPEVRVHRRGSQLQVQSSAAVLTFALRQGAWTLRDHHGLVLFSARPGSTRVGATGARLELDLIPRERLFGLGETTGTFDRRGSIREFWNIDVLGHAPAIHPHLRRLYVSIPFAISLRDGRAAGLFWDNPGRQVWDLGSTQDEVWSLGADHGVLDLYLFVGPTVPDVVARYTELTGRLPLPPRWALGYHQCRYSYETGRELETVAAEFRRRQIPCDALYCDIHHLDGYRVFTFGKSYPQPRAMLRRLARQGFKVVTIVDPGVKDERRFGVLQRGRQRHAFVRAPDGKKDFLGEVWPGRARFPDFLNADARRWWGEEQQALFDLGVAGVWNDMNEPANFARPDKTLDPECQHRPDHGPRRHVEVHNVYGSEMARASREGALRGGSPTSRAPSATPRPFVITRAGYAGVQRHALVWTGDNSASWEHLADAVQMLQNLGLSGVGFVGADVGGFLENTSAELFVRWLQMAVFTPFLRNHTNLGTRRQEPWAYGAEVESIARAFLNLRYQLLPYLYGLFAEGAANGTPIMRPLLWHYPNDPVAVLAGDQFLLGRDLLVAPILRPGAEARAVYLPRGEWFDFWSQTRVTGGTYVTAIAPLERIPLFVRAGAILPMAPSRPSIGPREPASLMVHLWPGDAGECVWYDDDGRTQAYTEGRHVRRRLRLEPLARGMRLHVGATEGPYRSAARQWRFLLHQVPRALVIRTKAGALPTQHLPEVQAQIFEIPATTEALEIRWG